MFYTACWRSVRLSWQIIALYSGDQIFQLGNARVRFWCFCIFICLFFHGMQNPDIIILLMRWNRRASFPPSRAHRIVLIIRSYGLWPMEVQKLWNVHVLIIVWSSWLGHREIRLLGKKHHRSAFRMRREQPSAWKISKENGWYCIFIPGIIRLAALLKRCSSMHPSRSLQISVRR